MIETCLDGRGLPEISAELHHPDPGIALRPVQGQLPGTVCAPVVDQDQFGRVGQVVQHIENFLDGRIDVLFLLIERDDYAQIKFANLFGIFQLGEHVSWPRASSRYRAPAGERNATPWTGPLPKGGSRDTI